MDGPSGIDRRTLARHIAADVDRAAPLLARILLLRAVSNIRYNHGGHALWVARDMAADCGAELEAAGATTRELARALVPDHDTDRDLTPAIDATRGLSHAIRSEDDAYARYSMATDPDISIDKKRAGELGDEWEEQRRHLRRTRHGMPTGLGSGEIGCVLLDRALDRVFKRGMYYQTRYYLFSAKPERQWRRRVTGVLHAAACVKLDRGNQATAADLAVNIRNGRRTLDGTAQSAWGRQAVSRLEALATPVFAQQEPLTPHKATAIRLLALCLAREAEAARTPAPGAPFRGIVVGVTRLEQATLD
ncbi:hypothetical protein BZB76_2487 [Actinomadura pelletieri DSM 43383]|uniref:HD domain-containing protein n=1 Tax=Actinomadura pelletieri DSM 43383 TaxID=1120940 RepID=A0A495QUM3_9ACTN|nr:hypothetical protein [Actinomadura pelletieri]RKS77113.1 hypothetical protein BZB76_2487 [Actinomadura pelletieri DSM 43383]